jgi:hypothetical protein
MQVLARLKVFSVTSNTMPSFGVGQSNSHKIYITAFESPKQNYITQVPKDFGFS